jgi:hypothetical protein
LIAAGRVAVFGRQAHGVQRPDVHAAIDLLHRPQAPLPSLGFALEGGGIEAAVLLGEIEGDRKRLPQQEAAVIDRRQAAVGIDREVFRLARARRADLDWHVLVVEAELLGDPERAKGAGAGDPVNAQVGHPLPQLICSLNLLIALR